jgi:putative transposase
LATLARLGVRLTHSKPGRPQGRGKIERAFRTVREQFLVEIGTGRELDDMAELNKLFTAWVETVYHQRVHSETGQAPLQRWDRSWAAAREAGRGPVLTSPDQLREAFLWSEERAVTKTATVSLQGNTYEVDAALVGRKVELRFDPFDLGDIAVAYQGRDMGKAVPHEVKRHVHPKARPDETTAPVEASGIDYLKLLAARHERDIVAKVSYADIADPGEAAPGPTTPFVEVPLFSEAVA